jgi:hypothetical protein
MHHPFGDMRASTGVNIPYCISKQMVILFYFLQTLTTWRDSINLAIDKGLRISIIDRGWSFLDPFVSFFKGNYSAQQWRWFHYHLKVAEQLL